MFNLATLFIDIAVQTARFDRAMQNIHGQLSRADLAVSTFSANIATSLVRAAASMAGGLFDSTILSAADLHETLNKTQVVFGSAASGMIGFADEMASKFALPKQTMLDAASVIGLMGRQAGQTRGEAADFGIEMTKLAIDAKSFYDVPIDVALSKIQAGLSGMSRPLRELGVFINAAQVKEEGLRMGLAATSSELTEGDKIMARASLIRKGFSDATGDMERTFHETRNQMAAFWGVIKNLGQDIGTLLMPAFDGVLGSLMGLARGMASGFKDNRSMFAGWVQSVVSGGSEVKSYLGEVGSAFTFVFNRVRDTFSPLPGLLYEWFVVPLDVITGGAISRLPGQFAAIASSAKEWLGAVRVEIRNFSDTWEIATLTIGRLWLELSAAVQSIAAGIGAFVVESLASIAGAFLQVSTTIAGYLLMPGEYLVMGITKAIEAVGSIWDAFVGAFATGMDYLLRPLRDMYNAITGETMSVEEDFGRLKGVFDAPAAGGKALSDIIGGLRNNLTAVGGQGAAGLDAWAKGGADGMRAWGDAAKSGAAEAAKGIDEQISAASDRMAGKESARVLAQVATAPKTELQGLAEAATRASRMGEKDPNVADEEDGPGKSKKNEIVGAAEFASKLRLAQGSEDVPQKQLTELQQIREQEMRNGEALAKIADFSFGAILA